MAPFKTSIFLRWSHYVVYAGLELLGLSNHPASASQVADSPKASHCTQLKLSECLIFGSLIMIHAS